MGLGFLLSSDLVRFNLEAIRVFPKMGYPKLDGLYWKTLLKWMIWGYHNFRKPPQMISVSQYDLTSWDGDTTPHDIYCRWGEFSLSPEKVGPSTSEESQLLAYK